MRSQRAVVVAAIALLLLAACSSDAGTATTGNPVSAASTSSSSSESSSSSSTAAAPTTRVQLTGKEYSYAADSVNGAAPSGDITVPAGPVEVVLNNAGTEEHQATIVRLNDGVSLQQFAAAGASDPTGAAAFKLLTAFGGPNATPAGALNGSTQVLTQPGNYLFACFIPGPDGVPHAAKGMILPFTVTPPASTQTLTASSTVGANEFSFKVPDKVKSGQLALTNNGTQAHELAVYKLADGKTINDARTFLSTPNPSGPPPYSPNGGIGPIAPGTTATTTINLDKGSYLFICFLPDVNGNGAPHFTKGMLQEVDVS